MKFASFLLSIILLGVVVGAIGCSTADVATTEGWLNNINSAIVDPLANQTGTDGLSPYVRWLFGNVRTFGYALIDFIRVAAPNAGELKPPPLVTPSTQPSANTSPPAHAALYVVSR